jgi:hypothetical protein
MASNPFSGFFDKIHAFIQWIEDAWNGIVALVEDLVDIRSIIEDDFNATVATFKDLTQETQDFAEKITTLKRRVIRADEIFQLIEEIRTGELKEFLVDTLGELKGETQNAFNDALSAGQSLGAFRTGQLGSPNAVVEFVKRIVTVAALLAKFVHALKAIQPALEKINQKVAEFEGIILSQSRPKVKVTDPGYHYSRRG